MCHRLLHQQSHQQNYKQRHPQSAITRYLNISLSCSLLMLSLNVTAVTESPRNDSLYYYKIGGGRHISIPPSLTITNLNLSGSANFAALSCDGFDPIVSLESSLDDLKRGVDNAINAIEAAASAAIVNLPGYILQKSQPGALRFISKCLIACPAKLLPGHQKL